ncbi:MAG: ATP-dependent sacrificial sulfur transferase LarE [Planctomycetaceae bacterium]|nr:ATP-dependent sacrificial sulfur transferase LarE [Planctomycetaceae bacterium]
MQLVAALREAGSVAVAFSGGVDSAVVAKAATLALGDRAVAVIAESPSLAVVERDNARTVAGQIGIRLIAISTIEFTRPEYRANAGDRCFFCKDTLYAMAGQLIQQLNVNCLVNGSNLDDLGDHRPGMRAADQHGVRSPLIECQIDKQTVRELARFWNLTVAEKPASPCLSSRIAYGVEVTEARVKMVEDAEAALRRLTGLMEFRVRLEHGDVARIEIPLSDLFRLTESTVRKSIVDELRACGFQRVTLDLEGFRSGSLNAALTDLVPLQIP